MFAEYKLQHDLTRIIVGFLLFSSNVFFASLTHNTPYITILDTIYTSCIVILLCSLAIFLYTFFIQSNNYSSKYKPPFTFFYITIHVYALGFIVFVLLYCALNTSIAPTWLFLAGLISIHVDDIMERRNEAYYLHVLKVLSVTAICTGIFLIIWNDHENIDLQDGNILSASWFNIIFIIFLPATTPILFYFFRNTQYHPHIRDTIWDLIQFAMPFASIISGLLLVSLQDRCAISLWLSSETVPGNLTYSDTSTNNTTADSQHIWIDNRQAFSTLHYPYVLLTTLSSIGILFFTFYSILSYNAVDVLFTFGLSVLCKHLFLYPQNDVSVWCFLSLVTAIKFRAVYCLQMYRKTKLESSVRLESTEDFERAQAVPFSDGCI